MEGREDEGRDEWVRVSHQRTYMSVELTSASPSPESIDSRPGEQLHKSKTQSPGNQSYEQSTTAPTAPPLTRHGRRFRVNKVFDNKNGWRG